MGFLLDTNVLSELRRPRPEPKVVEFVSSQSIDLLHISVVTLAELRFGIELLDESSRRQDLQKWLDSRVRPMFVGRVLPVSEDVLLQWRLFVEIGRKSGHTFSQPDLIIAATAAHFGHVAVTRDRREFDKAGVAVLNPWD